MSRRFPWILPLLLGAGIASLFWWKSTLPAYVHGALQQQEGLAPGGVSSTPSSSGLELQPAPLADGARSDASLEDGSPAAQMDRNRPSDAARLRVQLVDAAGGGALAGVKVVAFLDQQPGGRMRTTRSTDLMRGSLDWSPTSDANGFVEFDLPPDAAVRLSVRPDPNTHQPLNETVLPLHPFEQRDLRLAVQSVHFTPYFALVRDRSNGQPIGGAWVRIFSPSDLSAGPLEAQSNTLARASSNGHGMFQVDASERSSMAWIQAPGFGPTLVALDAAHADSHNPRDLYLTPGSWLAVYLRNHEGKPLGDIPITLTATTLALVQSEAEPIQHSAVVWRGTTNRFGRAEFDSLPADTPLHVAFQVEGDSVVDPPPMQILSPGEARELEWTIGGGTRLMGDLHSEESVPLAGQELWLLPASSPGSQLITLADQARVLHKTHSDPNGHFVFSGIPAGAWWIAPASNGTSTHLAPLARRYEVPEGLPELNVQLEVFGPRWVEGRVRQPDGEVADHEQVWLHSIEVPGDLSEWTRADGTFRIGPLAPGLVEVGVRSSPDHVGSPPQVCTADERHLEIRLSHDTRMVALLATQDGSPLPPVERILLTHPDGSVSDELNLAWEGLERGNYGVCVLTQDGRVAVAQRVFQGSGIKSGEALLELAPGAKVEFSGPGKYSLWMESACVTMGELGPDETRTEVVPTGTLRLERPDRTQPGVALEATLGRPVRIDLARAASGPGLAPRTATQPEPPPR
ncbi:MAG: hypothetical protein H6830_07525 [Planctomycetes bacterium]|nr:hypothetical protein [Planctomycetota bacterium]MCB9910248.1 hypothetical protein [Planctomycetota bacterium]